MREFPFFLAAIVAFFSFAVYLNGLFNGFVYDDIFQVTENQWITDIRYIPEIFTKSVWGFQAWASSSNYYRPLMHLMYMICYYIFGLTPWGFHLLNILFHVANSVLVLVVGSTLLKQDRTMTSVPPGSAGLGGLLSPPFIAALLFAVHPVHTEAVTWVAALPEVSFTCLYLISFLFYMGSKGSFNRAYVLSLIFFFLSSLCKETALTLPLILMVYDLALRNEKFSVKKILTRFLPFGIAGAIYLIMRFNALGGLAPEKKHLYLSAYQHLINVFPLFSQYLQKLILPVNLNAFYVFHPVYSPFEIKTILSFALLAALSIIAVASFKKYRMEFFALILITVPLLPVLYIPGLGENTFTERYLYLPSAGFSILAGLLIAGAKVKIPSGIYLAASTLLIVAGLYSFATVNRNIVWKDDLSLYSDTAKKSPDGFIPNNNLGYALMKAGRIDEALKQLKAALSLKPDMVDIMLNNCIFLMQKGLTDKAMLELNNVLLLDPGRADGHYYLGRTYALKGWLSQALDEYREVVRLKSDYPHIHSDLAEVYAMQGRVNEAMAEFEAALKANPSDAQASNNLGVLHMQAGHIDRAIELYRTAVKLKPDNPIFRKNLDEALNARSVLKTGGIRS